MEIVICSLWLLVSDSTNSTRNQTNKIPENQDHSYHKVVTICDPPAQNQ